MPQYNDTKYGSLEETLNELYEEKNPDFLKKFYLKFKRVLNGF